MKRYFLYFLFIGVILTLLPFETNASQLLPGGDKGQCYFQETFSDKELDNNQVKDKKERVIWQINTVEGQRNSITDTGALELGDARYMQRAVLNEEFWANKQDYAMEFTVNIQKLGNEGYSGRPVAIIIPRTKDKGFKEYYAVTYYMENTVANLFKFKWAIINTAAPTKMAPLVEGYYLLQENVDYTARLVLKNTAEGNVNIKFYLDGPTNPVKEYKPLLEYTDTTKYKILFGVTGPAFGTVGYADSGWGTSPVVRYDNIRLYDFAQFKEYEKDLKKFTLINPADIEADKAYGEIKYLINRGILANFSDNKFKPDEYVNIAEFLKSLIALKSERRSGDYSYRSNYIKQGIELGIIQENESLDYKKPLTKYDAALMLTRFCNNLREDDDSFKGPRYKSYSPFIKDYDHIPVKYLDAVLYTYYEGYLRLDDNFEFKGGNFVSRSEIATILLRMLDTGFRKVNYELELPQILSSGAVFQGNKKIPVWGRGISGETVTVSFKNQLKTTVVKDGHWYLELEPEPYGGPYTLTVKNTKDTIKLEDIMVGEVFVVAGQSNAEMFLYECYGADETSKKFKDKANLRFYSGEQITAVRPNFTSVGSWEHAYDWVLDYSPAIGTFFAEALLDLNKDLIDVTIGIIRMTYGGTTIEAFMPNSIIKEKKYVQKDDEPIMSGFWNGFMESITPFSVKAIIYYQGENSTQLGYGYEPLLRDYLRGLRIEFKDSKIPIMLVQLAGYGYNDYQSDSNEWPIIREIQLRVANTTDNTGLVTAVDLSDSDPLEIHPKEKKEIGRRLAHLGMEMIYEKVNMGSSAQVKKCYFNGNEVLISFKNIFRKLYFKDDIPKDIQLLNNNWEWHMAETELYGNNTIRVWNDDIRDPIGVRYAWVNNPNISLYNKLDLPVLPFRVILEPESTGEKILKIKNHSLRPGDAVVNTTRSNQFRTVNIIDPDLLSYVYGIGGQSAGDRIDLLTRITELKAETGTTETIIKISSHGLSVGDWIRNNTRDWTTRRIEAVLDEETIQVTAIPGQSANDNIEIYQYVRTVVAE